MARMTTPIWPDNCTGFTNRARCQCHQRGPSLAAVDAKDGVHVRVQGTQVADPSPVQELRRGPKGYARGGELTSTGRTFVQRQRKGPPHGQWQ